MGGCAIYIQLSVGPVSAHLNCAFDAIVQFHPVSSTRSASGSMQLIRFAYQLHYIIDFGVDVGVSCHVHVLFISFDISIDIGADLHIEGPSFGGKAQYVFTFLYTLRPIVTTRPAKSRSWNCSTSLFYRKSR